MPDDCCPELHALRANVELLEARLNDLFPAAALIDRHNIQIEHLQREIGMPILTNTSMTWIRNYLRADAELAPRSFLFTDPPTDVLEWLELDR